ncbi:MAG: hypothetical protein AABX00_01145 [Nanoarchaeota archaeon]
MEFLKFGWAGVYILIGLYLIYRIFLKRDPHKREYEKMYHEIVNSDKYKVKGQWK